NADIATYIKYQTSWPGYDPMNEDNPSEVSNRVGYYSVGAVPDASVNGGSTQSPSSITQNTLNNASNVPSPCNISMQHWIEDEVVHVVMFIEATQDMIGNMAAHMVICEELIEFNSPPGSNGEKEFEHVMKKMLPSASGKSIDNIAAGDYIVLEESYPLGDINWYGDYNEQMMIIGFVQNNSSKEVLQAAVSSTEQITPINNLDIALNEINNLGDNMCINTFAPQVTFSNYGAEAITSCTINYQINNGEVHTQEWSGNIEFLSSINATLEAVTFELTQENEMNIYLSNINGGDDDYTNNNAIVQSFEKTAHTSLDLNFFLMLDENPEETTWEVVNSVGDVMYSGGPYANGGIVQETFTFETSDCYQFIIYDAGGNGICCKYGAGVFNLRDSDNFEFGQGGTFTDSDFVNFEIDFGIGIDKNVQISSIEVFPNPAKDITYLKMNLRQASNVDVIIYNAIGQKIISKKLHLQAGETLEPIDVNQFNKGLYFIEVKSENETFNQKVLIK
ncbi:MAG: T9SS type A sorting domain-containing protein, partial [Bacteroidales bacterium]|nr:T9SS type A sorting domain-containing protein [Bacteroidales bacterium]